MIFSGKSSVADPDPKPDPDLPESVRGMDPDPAPDLAPDLVLLTPSKRGKKNLDSYYFVTSF
jgi:hypothetical protein